MISYNRGLINTTYPQKVYYNTDQYYSILWKYEFGNDGKNLRKTFRGSNGQRRSL